MNRLTVRMLRKEQSRDLGWNVAMACVEGQYFFKGVFKQKRAMAVRDGWLDFREYVSGFLSVITDYGRSPRRKGGAM